MNSRPPRSVIVTGGASGIGLAIAQAFNSLGDTVWVADSDVSAVAKLGHLDERLAARVCDVADPDAVATFVAEVAAGIGSVDVLINNAGVAGPTARVEDVLISDWNRVLSVNLTGAFLMSQQAIPHLIRSQGVIVNIGSVAGRFGYPQRSPYCVSKWGLIGLTKTMAMELGQHRVRVNAVLPGPVAGERIDAVVRGRADFGGSSTDAVQAQLVRSQSIKHITEAREVADVVVFLAGPKASMISGQAIPIDGDMQSAV